VEREHRARGVNPQGKFFIAQAAAKAMKAAAAAARSVQTGSMWGCQAIGATIRHRPIQRPMVASMPVRNLAIEARPRQRSA